MLSVPGGGVGTPQRQPLSAVTLATITGCGAEVDRGESALRLVGERWTVPSPHSRGSAGKRHSNNARRPRRRGLGTVQEDERWPPYRGPVRDPRKALRPVRGSTLQCQGRESLRWRKITQPIACSPGVGREDNTTTLRPGIGGGLPRLGGREALRPIAYGSGTSAGPSGRRKAGRTKPAHRANVGWSAIPCEKPVLPLCLTCAFHPRGGITEPLDIRCDGRRRSRGGDNGRGGSVASSGHLVQSIADPPDPCSDARVHPCSARNS